MLDSSQLDDLLSIWKTANNRCPGARIPAFLALDAVALKPLIAIQEGDSVEGMEGLDCLESPDLFSQFVLNPYLFHDFVVTHWNENMLCSSCDSGRKWKRNTGNNEKTGTA
jgi:hypothetical protein